MLEELAGALVAPPATLVFVAPMVVARVTLEEGVTTGTRVEADTVELEPAHLVQTVLVRTSVWTLVVLPAAEVIVDEAALLVFEDEAVTLAVTLADEDPDAEEDEEDPPVMWNGKEYWNVAGLESRTILKP